MKLTQSNRGIQRKKNQPDQDIQPMILTLESTKGITRSKYTTKNKKQSRKFRNSKGIGS